MTDYAIIKQRRDTAANWTSANPTLADGEVGWERDTGKKKTGDGSTAWSSLGYDYLTPTELAATYVALSRPTADAPGLGVYFPEAHGAIGNGSTDDTTAVQAAITAAEAVNGTVQLGENAVYKITDKLTVTGNCSIVGHGCDEVGFDGSTPTAAPFLSGSVILQSGAAKDGLQLTGTALHVNLRQFGVRFASTVWGNTGHGVVQQASGVVGAGHDFSVQNSVWEGVKVFGHDGNHYAFIHTNVLLNTYINLRSYGGGGHKITTDSNVGITGNLVFVHPYHVMFNAGSAHAYVLDAFAAPGGGNGGTNLITMLRPQVNVLDYSANAAMGNPTHPTVSQYMFLNGPTHEASSIDLIDPDFEASAGVHSPVNFGTPPNVIVRNGGTILMGGGANPVYATNRSGYNARPAIAAGTGAGTGATVGIGDAISGIQSTDRGGLINITTGTTPSGRLTDVVTITLAQMVNPLAVHLTPANDAAAQVDWFVPVGEITSTTFTIQAESTLAGPGGLYQLYYTVTPQYD